MASALRISRICLLLSGSTTEAAQGLNILVEELQGDDGVSILTAFLTTSPTLTEVTSLLSSAASQHEAAKALVQCIQTGEGSPASDKLFSALHALVAEHVQTLAQWLSGDRGQNCCRSALRLLTAINNHAHSLLHHRLTLVVRGPWTATDPFWLKKAKAEQQGGDAAASAAPVKARKRKGGKETSAAGEDDMRRLGLEFMLSFVEPKQGKAAQGSGVALGTKDFVVSLCATLAFDGEALQRRVVAGVCGLMATSNVPRSKRAHTFERRGVLSEVVALARHHLWAEAALTQSIVPSLAVPEGGSYDLSAKILPNHVLLQILKLLTPQKCLPHRRILRTVLQTAPSLAYHYATTHLHHGAVSLTNPSDPNDTMAILAALDVVLTLLEAPLPSCFTRGVLCSPAVVASGASSTGDAASAGRDSHVITPDYVVELLLPTFVSHGLTTLLKSSCMMVVMQCLSICTMVVKRLRLMASALRTVEYRRRSLEGAAEGSAAAADHLTPFLAAVRQSVSARLPPPGVFIHNLKVDASKMLFAQAPSPVAADGHPSHRALSRYAEACEDDDSGADGFYSAKRRALLYRYERILSALRLLQMELPLYMAGVSVAKLFFPEGRAVADKPGSALAAVTPTASLLTLQILSHDAAFRPSSLLTAKPGCVTPMAEVLSYHARLGVLAESGGDAASAWLRIREESLILVRVVLASVLVTPATEGSVDEAEARAWADACVSLADCVCLSNALQLLLNDVCGEKRPFSRRAAADDAAAATAQQQQPTTTSSPLLSTCLREAKKDAKLLPIIERFRAAAAAAEDAPPTAVAPRVSAAYGLPEAAPAVEYGADELAAAGVALTATPDDGSDSLAQHLAGRARRAVGGARAAAAAAAAEADEGVDEEDDDWQSVVGRYTGTLSTRDQKLFAIIRRDDILSQTGYQIGPGVAGASFDASYPLKLATKVLGERAMSETVVRYPLVVPDVAGESAVDEPQLVDPRFFTEVLAAHLSACVAQTPPVVPDLRRSALAGIIPLLVKGLSSRIDGVRTDAYTALACLKQLAPENTAFYMLLTHMKNSCWSAQARIPVSLSTFLAACTEVVFNKAAWGSAGGAAFGSSIQPLVAHYLLSFPYTRRGDVPFAECLVKPAKGGPVAAQNIQLFVVETVSRMLSTMRQGGKLCGNTVGALVSSHVFPNAVSVVANPLAGENLREQAAKMLEVAVGALPTVFLSKLRFVPVLAHAAASLKQSATGDLRAVVVSKNWAVKTRLASLVALILLNNPAEKRTPTASLLPDYAAAYHELLLHFMSLGGEVTSNASVFAPICLVTIEVLSSYMLAFLKAKRGKSKDAVGNARVSKDALRRMLLPIPFDAMEQTILSLCSAHSAVADVTPSLPLAVRFLEQLKQSLAEDATAAVSEGAEGVSAAPAAAAAVFKGKGKHKGKKSDEAVVKKAKTEEKQKGKEEKKGKGKGKGKEGAKRKLDGQSPESAAAPPAKKARRSKAEKQEK